VRTIKRANISLDEIAKLSLADAYLKTVVGHPHTRACVAWLTVLYPVFSELAYGQLDRHTDRVRDRSTVILDGSKWRVDLNVDQLYKQLWRTVATPEIRPPIENPLDGGYVVVPSEDCPPYPDPSYRADRNPVLQTARAIAERHEEFVSLLRNSALIARGMPEGSYAMEPLSAEVWNEHGLYLDVSSNALFEVGVTHSEPRPRRIYRQLWLAVPVGKTTAPPKKLPKKKRHLLDALSEHNIRSRKGLDQHLDSDEQLIAKLVERLKGRVTFASDAALQKMLSRLTENDFAMFHG
jgi:hypothetical protein